LRDFLPIRTTAASITAENAAITTVAMMFTLLPIPMMSSGVLFSLTVTVGLEEVTLELEGVLDGTLERTLEGTEDGTLGSEDGTEGTEEVSLTHLPTRTTSWFGIVNLPFTIAASDEVQP